MKARIALSVDDRVESRLLINRILSKQGYQVVEANGATEAIEALQNQAFDVVVLDIVMSEMDGFEITRKVRAGDIGELNRNTVIVGHSGLYVGDRDLSKEATGMDHFFQKPILIHEFANKVNELVEMA